jgi:hypothetical protein
MNQRRVSFSWVAFTLALSALSASAATVAEPRCYPGFTLVRGQCTLLVRGEVQRPYQFSLNDRSSSGWRAAQMPPVDMRGEVVRATRVQPF